MLGGVFVGKVKKQHGMKMKCDMKSRLSNANGEFADALIL
jgi:hypothetical protein